MKASLSKRSLASVLGGAALVGVAVTGVAVSGANAATSPGTVTPHTVGYSNRVCSFGVQHLFRQTFGAPVSAGQPIVASASEVDGSGNEFAGAAPVSVDNVAVQNGVIIAVADADWTSPINVCVHYIG